MSFLVIVQRHSQLLQIVFALRSSGRFASLLDGGQQQRYQNCDDCNDDEQFDQCESSWLSSASSHESVFRFGPEFRAAGSVLIET